MRFVAWCVLAALLNVGPVHAVDLGELPSPSFRDSLANEPNLFEGIDADAAKRESAFFNAWFTAIANSPVDNRPYLMALAIDLYNSLPPNSCVQPADGPPSCGKVGAAYEMRSYFRIDDEERRWQAERWQRVLVPRTGVGTGSLRESSYLRRYIAESNIQFDDPRAEPSLAHVNVLNPTHHAEFKKWMDETAQMREQGVPPWEALKLAGRQVAEPVKQIQDKPPAEVPSAYPASAEPVAVQSSDEARQEPNQLDESSPLFIWLSITAVMILFIGVLVVWKLRSNEAQDRNRDRPDPQG